MLNVSAGLSSLIDQSFQVAYIDIIPCSHTLHPVENSICAIYLRFENDNKGYIISVNHSETINFDLETVERVLNSIEKRVSPF